MRHSTGLRFDEVASLLNNARPDPAPCACFALRQILPDHTSWLVFVNNPTHAVLDLVSCFANRDVLRHEKPNFGPLLDEATNGPMFVGLATY